MATAGNVTTGGWTTEREGRVDRRSNLSYREFVHEYLLPKKPVILTDALEIWPARHKWTPEFFKEHHGNKIVKIQGKDMRLGDFIDEVLASTPERPSAYLSGLFVRQQFREIESDIEPDLKYTLPDRVRSALLIGNNVHRRGIPELLIAGRGARFRLHYDARHMLGFVTQLYGDKEFLIFPPSDGKYLYPDPDNPKFSLVPNIFEPDMEQFPLLAHTSPIRFVLRPGETIFNPAEWWHGTRMLTPSVAMVISTVNRSNWRDFVADVGRNRPSVPKIATVAMRGYLHCVGLLLSVKEELLGALSWWG